jgi:hypothetical protein
MHRRRERVPVALISRCATYGDPRSLPDPCIQLPAADGLNSAGTWLARTLYRSIYEHTCVHEVLHARPQYKHPSSNVYGKRRTAATVACSAQTPGSVSRPL